MYESFDAFEYIEYLRRRWRIIAAACVSAALIAFALSLLITKRYTATASLVIEPPGGSDARVATAVSAVYLESLKTYERFAASDTLFARAVQQFHLQDSGAPVALESLKHGVLKVSKLRDTKILEISVALPDPKQAQNVAQYLAEETVRISRGESLESDRTFVEESSKQLAEIQARLAHAQKDWTDLAATAPVAALSAEIESSGELQSNLRQQLVDTQSNVAEYQQQAQSSPFAREQLQAALARSALIEKRLLELTRDIQQKSATLAARTAKRDVLQTELKMAQTQYEAAASRQREWRATAGTRSEQLRVIDPGIVPQRPSSPNIPLNVGAAILLALVASTVYLSVAFVYRRRSVGFEPAISRGMRA